MDQDTKPKEILVKLMDITTVDKKFEKKYAAVYVQQDRRYVDMLIFNDENSFCKLVYNPYSKVKFTLKNMKTSQTLGSSNIVMRLLKDIKGKTTHVLPLDGQTYAEMDVQNGYIPNIELEYEWKLVTDKKKIFEAKDKNDSGITEALERLKQLIAQLLDLLNQQIEGDKEMNQEFIQYLENKVALLVQRITTEEENVKTGLENSIRTLKETQSLNEQFEASTMESVDVTNNSIRKVDTLMAVLDSNIEEAKKRNLEVRKKTGAIATLSNEAKDERHFHEEKRHKVKSVIDNLLGRIVQIELENLKQLDTVSLNRGLHEAEEATKLFDDVLVVDQQLISPHGNDKALLETKEIYDDKLHNVKILEHEVGILDKSLGNLDTEISQNLRELEVVKQQRQKQIQENLRLERLIKELEDKEEKEARNLELLREKATPIKDISLKTTRRLQQTRSKSKLATTKMKITLGNDDIILENEEMQPEKLSSTLVGTKHKRERARSDLGEGESKWKSKVNTIYEGVEELYTPSTTEMDQRAEIHRLLDELKDTRTRTERLY